MKFKLTLSLTISLLSALSAYSQIQDKKITLDDIYKQYVFSSNRVSGINSMNDGTHYSVSNKGRSIEKHNYF